MNRIFATTALVAALGIGSAALAQTAPPVGGPSAKGNAPVKHVHTVNDGAAKPGANSFTEGQARQHILNSGYTDVTGLAKGKDGVWRGTATKDGAPVSVAMDFKGNVTEAAAGGGAGAASSATMGGGAMSSGAAASGSGGNAGGAADAGVAAAGAGAASATHAVHHARHHRHHRHGSGHCAQPGPNGVACSGVSTMENGVSDREARTMQSGAHP